MKDLDIDTVANLGLFVGTMVLMLIILAPLTQPLI